MTVPVHRNGGPLEPVPAANVEPAPPVRFTGQNLQILREQMAPDASNEDLAYFAAVCNRLELSPFADQIVLIGRRDRRVGRVVHRHQITVTGRRTLATRTGNLTGIEGPVWCGPRETRHGGQLVWREVWDDDERPPYCARVLVHVKGWVTPANGTAKWTEFAQYNSDGKLAQLWNQMPSLMLGKCAESLALRRAFPDVITADTVNGFDPETIDVAAEAAAAVVQPPMPVAHPTAGGWTPSNADQADAHRVVANLPVTERTAFMSRHRIDDFGSVWPPEAVAEILAGPVDVTAGDTTAGPAGRDG